MKDEKTPLHRLAQGGMTVFGMCAALTSVSLGPIGETFRLDYTQLGNLALARGACVGIVTVSAGFLATRFGKKLFMLLAMYIVLIVGIALMFVDRYALLLIVFAFWGVGLGFLESLLNPLVAELYPETAGQRLNALNALFPIGMMAAALGAGFAFRANANWRVLFLTLGLIAGAIGIACQFARFPKLPTSSAPRATLKGVSQSRVFWSLGFAMAFSAGVEGGLTYWGAKFVQTRIEASPLSGAYGIIAFAGLMAVGRLTTSKALNALRLKTVILLACFLGIFALTGLVFSKHLLLVLVFLAICGISVAPFWPSILALYAEVHKTAAATLAFALLAGFGILGYFTVPWVIGLTADAYGLPAAFSTMIVCLVVVAIIAGAVKSPPVNRDVRARGSVAEKPSGLPGRAVSRSL